MEDDPHKFLGSHITNLNTPADHFNFLKSKLEEKLSNLDQTLVRGEYKVAVYSRYVLPSLQFHFAVHNIHKTHLDLLDASARKFLKSWLGFPKRGATDLGIFHPNILGVKYPSQVYLESHMNNHINLMLSEDPVVKEAVNCQLEREGAWKGNHQLLPNVKQSSIRSARRRPSRSRRAAQMSIPEGCKRRRLRRWEKN